MNLNNTYLTSDLHLGDPRLDVFSRDLYFDFVDDMNETIINNINEVVKEDDQLFIIGDVCYNKRSVSLLDKIKCQNRHLIIGNYDEDKLDVLKDKFLTIRRNTFLEIDYKENDNFGIYLTHKPVNIIRTKQNAELSEKLKLGICGHIHALWKVKKYPVPMVNVSMDIWNFKPISLSRVLWQYNGIINHYDENVFFEDYKDYNHERRKLIEKVINLLIQDYKIQAVKEVNDIVGSLKRSKFIVDIIQDKLSYIDYICNVCQNPCKYDYVIRNLCKQFKANSSIINKIFLDVQDLLNKEE